MGLFPETYLQGKSCENISKNFVSVEKKRKEKTKKKMTCWCASILAIFSLKLFFKAT